ncbi:hypothetical protein ABW19_dt0204013 [Dactylella cylindrospora]|nr:hypothetical protein ABW19_dt0204013 [Dactylella cylindrospora]
MAPKTDWRSKRNKEIRTLAAVHLSEVLGHPVDQSTVRFKDSHRKGYTWMAVEVYIDLDMGEEVATELEMPDYVVNTTMYEWTANQSYQVLKWLKEGRLRAEKVVDEVNDERRGVGRGVRKIEKEEPVKRYFLDEVRIVVLTEEEKLTAGRKWTQPPATIKGPASDFVRWSMGLADKILNQKMKARYYHMEQSEIGGYTSSEDSILLEGSISEMGEFHEGSDFSEDIPLIYAK